MCTNTNGITTSLHSHTIRRLFLCLCLFAFCCLCTLILFVSFFCVFWKLDADYASWSDPAKKVCSNNKHRLKIIVAYIVYIHHQTNIIVVYAIRIKLYDICWRWKKNDLIVRIHRYIRMRFAILYQNARYAHRIPIATVFNLIPHFISCLFLTSLTSFSYYLALEAVEYFEATSKGTINRASVRTVFISF